MQLIKVYRATGTEHITKINTKKKTPFKHGKHQDEHDDDEEEKPQEQTQAKDGALITNFEVDVEEDTMYSGGIKGIRALKQQREFYTDEEIRQDEEKKYQYHKYEESKK